MAVVLAQPGQQPSWVVSLRLSSAYSSTLERETSVKVEVLGLVKREVEGLEEGDDDEDDDDDDNDNDDDDDDGHDDAATATNGPEEATQAISTTPQATERPPGQRRNAAHVTPTAASTRSKRSLIPGPGREWRRGLKLGETWQEKHPELATRAAQVSQELGIASKWGATSPSASTKRKTRSATGAGGGASGEGGSSTRGREGEEGPAPFIKTRYVPVPVGLPPRIMAGFVSAPALDLSKKKARKWIKVQRPIRTLGSLKGWVGPAWVTEENRAFTLSLSTAADDPPDLGVKRRDVGANGVPKAPLKEGQLLELEMPKAMIPRSDDDHVAAEAAAAADRAEKRRKRRKAAAAAAAAAAATNASDALDKSAGDSTANGSEAPTLPLPTRLKMKPPKVQPESDQDKIEAMPAVAMAVDA